MTKPTDPDPIELLRRSNPVDAERLPSANLARIRARVQEKVMTDIQPGAGLSLPQRRLRLTVGLAGVTALAAIALLVFGPKFNAPGVTPSDGGSGGGGGGTAMCIRFDLERLAQQEYAFDGTVTAIEGESVPFAVGRWYRGSGDMRFGAAGALMLNLVAAIRRPLPRGRSLGGAALYGVVGFAASYGFAYTGLRDVPPGTAMVLIALTPLFTFGLAIAHRQERFHVQGLFGALIALVGIGFVFVDQLSADVPLVPLLLVLLAAVAIAESSVIVKSIPRSDPFATNAVAMLTGAALLFVLSLVVGEPWRLPTQAATWAAVAYLVLFGSVVMFALFVFTLQRWTASAVSYMTLMMPLVTVALAAVLTDERITPSFVLGGAVILGGVYVGAFLKGRPARSSASSLPECLPIDACAEAEAEPAGA